MSQEKPLFIPQEITQPDLVSSSLPFEPQTDQPTEYSITQDIELENGVIAILPDYSPDPSISRQYHKHSDTPQRGDPSLHRPWPWK
ncbi:MAG TPA: hypothetical protein PLD54_03850 [Candidatus Levybacteria bacterium]|nr:hypothetical protein [Candidatus Levybacteria bacterium]